MASRVLLVDDDKAFASSFAFLFRNDYDLCTASNSAEALEYFRTGTVGVTVLDLRLKGENGLDLLRTMRGINPNCMVVVLTAHGSIRSSVEAMREGAFYYLTKPADTQELRSLIDRALEVSDLYSQVHALSQELRKKQEFRGIVWLSKSMSYVLDIIERIKNVDSTVLITGESGTGKELVARAIHLSGRRAGGPFQVVNCAAIPEHLMESELFGHAKGSFTGALYAYEGKLKAADQGSVFFDELGDLPLHLQVKLLRFLQDRTVTPVGSSANHKVNVRIIAATNRDLPAMVKSGQFREDLFYRMNVINLQIPPLRERREDIPILVRHFLIKHNRLLDKNVTSLSSEALRLLLEYGFPGNVRELENIIERAVALAEGQYITPSDLPAGIGSPGAVTTGVAEAIAIPLFLGESLRSAERKIIERTLAHTRGNRKEAARILGISDRTLRNKLKEYLSGN